MFVKWKEVILQFPLKPKLETDNVSICRHSITYYRKRLLSQKIKSCLWWPAIIVTVGLNAVWYRI